MSITLWAFQDGLGRVRVTPNDPGTVLEAPPHNRKKAVASSPGGFSVRDLRKYFDSTESTLAGQTGREVYVEFVLNDLDPLELELLLQPPEPE